MDVVLDLADRVAVMHHGALLVCDTPDGGDGRPRPCRRRTWGRSCEPPLLTVRDLQGPVGRSGLAHPAGRHLRGAADRRHRPARTQRRRQDHHPQGGARPDPARRRGHRRRPASTARGDSARRPTGWSARGLGYVPEDRGVFAGLTVAENLRLAERPARAPTTTRVYALFPELRQRGTAAGRHAVRRPAADGGDRPGAAQPQPAAAHRRADQGPRARRSSPRWPTCWSGSRRRCRCCWSSRTWPSSAGSAGDAVVLAAGAGRATPAPLAEPADDAELTKVAAGRRPAPAEGRAMSTFFLLTLTGLGLAGAVLPGRLRAVAGLRPGRRAELRARAVPRRSARTPPGGRPATCPARARRLGLRARRRLRRGGRRGGRGRWSSWC